MDQSGNGKEIEVRSLTGESIRVSIEPNKTVQDLKLLLKQSFSPASSSPNFHLFLKGVKLNLQNQISSYLIGVGEFLVVAPFVKKDRQLRHRVEASETNSEDPNPSEKLESKLAESAWSDLMQDLSSFQDISSRENLPGAELKSMNSVSISENAYHRRNSSRTMKPKKMLSKGKEKESSYDILLSILPASGDDMFDEQNLEMFLEFMDSSSCLSNPATGSCVIREANDLLDGKLDLSKSSLCFCPLWLKDIMRAFYFINVYSACLQLWQRKITISALEGPLDQLHKFGFRPGIADLEILSQFCPEVNYLIVETVLPCDGFRFSFILLDDLSILIVLICPSLF
ncbi:hypothetical protein CDL12_28754 [Handroanthus impetiginosus]|uniref:Ubiquitin-like domain-containing protein n=1 Tax=Handroanthus impetiginosus TaxID=429701 RepID=A0A2G9G0P6_9LAMI|nr:hypothetical protein CDL12_28754 [Handroanthus impetiginosus]